MRNDYSDLFKAQADKILLIRSARRLTVAMGKLGLKTCYSESKDVWGNFREYHGRGLKECKDYVERLIRET